jgi:hypothetical protein
MPRREPYPLRQVIGDSRRGPVPALLTGPLTTDGPAITSAGHAIEAGLGPACGSSRRQRAVDLESARPRQETSTDTVLLQALVTKLVLVRGSVATPTEQPPVRTLAATLCRKAADGEFTHVMVRLKTAELDIVDTLIAAGIANNRAEAIRWALTRIPERPAYEQLREHTRDIERLKSEF